MLISPIFEMDSVIHIWGTESDIYYPNACVSSEFVITASLGFRFRMASLKGAAEAL